MYCLLTPVDGPRLPPLSCHDHSWSNNPPIRSMNGTTWSNQFIHFPPIRIGSTCSSTSVDYSSSSPSSPFSSFYSSFLSSNQSPAFPSASSEFPQLIPVLSSPPSDDQWVTSDFSWLDHWGSLLRRLSPKLINGRKWPGKDDSLWKWGEKM